MNLFCNTDMNRSAKLSGCGRHRYQLARCWRPDAKQLGWIMLNPSTANGLDDDPTIRRCMTFARAWDFGGIVVANLFTLRATDPAELTAPGVDRQAMRSTDEVLSAAFDCAMTVAAWGSHDVVEASGMHVVVRRISHVRRHPLHCLAINKDGHPRHPLYVRGDARPTIWCDPNEEAARA